MLVIGRNFSGLLVDKIIDLIVRIEFVRGFQGDEVF